jgi:hypothetical protein
VRRPCALHRRPPHPDRAERAGHRPRRPPGRVPELRQRRRRRRHQDGAARRVAQGHRDRGHPARAGGARLRARRPATAPASARSSASAPGSCAPLAPRRGAHDRSSASRATMLRRDRGRTRACVRRRAGPRSRSARDRRGGWGTGRLDSMLIVIALRSDLTPRGRRPPAGLRGARNWSVEQRPHVGRDPSAGYVSDRILCESRRRMRARHFEAGRDASEPEAALSPPRDTGPAMSQENVELVRRVLEAWKSTSTGTLPAISWRATARVEREKG